MVGGSMLKLLHARGCRKVVCLDVSSPPEWFRTEDWADTMAVEFHRIDIVTQKEEMERVFRGCQIVFHVAALVGPYHAHDQYEKVLACPSDSEDSFIVIKEDYQAYCSVVYSKVFPFGFQVNVLGTRNVLEACEQAGVGAFVECSTPCARLLGADINGLTEEELDQQPRVGELFLHEYGRTKLVAEKIVLAHNRNAENKTRTIAILPHQVT